VNNRNSSLNVHSVTGNVTVEGSGDVATFSNISGALTVNADFFGGSHFQKIAQPSVRNPDAQLAAAGINTARGQSPQEAEEPAGWGKVRNVNAEFEAGFAGLGGHLNCAVHVNGANLLAGKFPDFLSLDTYK